MLRLVYRKKTVIYLKLQSKLIEDFNISRKII